MQRVALILLAVLSLPPALLAQSPPPTFTKDVAAILQKNCQTYHRPGEGGPFPLLTYEQVRPMATSIKRVAQQKTMPPWSL
jgi:hypothetical protein